MDTCLKLIFETIQLQEQANGVRYRRLGRTRSGNGKLPKLRKSSKKRAESQPSGARFVGQELEDSTPAILGLVARINASEFQVRYKTVPNLRSARFMPTEITLEK
jgi:hypothetical protein